MGRIVKGSEDCCDCLCRVCARNDYFDTYSSYVRYKDCIPCEYCEAGKTRIVDVPDDCMRWSFVPDEDDVPDYFKREFEIKMKDGG